MTKTPNPATTKEPVLPADILQRCADTSDALAYIADGYDDKQRAAPDISEDACVFWADA